MVDYEEGKISKTGDHSNFYPSWGMDILSLADSEGLALLSASGYAWLANISKEQAIALFEQRSSQLVDEYVEHSENWKEVGERVPYKLLELTTAFEWLKSDNPSLHKELGVNSAEEVEDWYIHLGDGFSYRRREETIDTYFILCQFMRWQELSLEGDPDSFILPLQDACEVFAHNHDPKEVYKQFLSVAEENKDYMWFQGLPKGKSSSYIYYHEDELWRECYANYFDVTISLDGIKLMIHLYCNGGSGIKLSTIEEMRSLLLSILETEETYLGLTCREIFVQFCQATIYSGVHAKGIKIFQAIAKAFPQVEPETDRLIEIIAEDKDANFDRHFARLIRQRQ